MSEGTEGLSMTAREERPQIPGWPADAATTRQEVKNLFAKVLRQEVPREAACSFALSASTWAG